MSFAIKFVRQRLVPFAYAFLFFVSMHLFPAFNSISAFVSRLHREESSVEKNGEEIEFLEAETELSNEKDIEFDGDGVEEKEEVFLKFKFPTFQEFCRIHEKIDDLSNSEGLSFRSSGIKCTIPFVDELDTSPVEEGNGNRKRESGDSGQEYNEISVCSGGGNDDYEAEESVEKSEKKLRSAREDEKFGGNQDFLDEPQCFTGKNSMFNGSGSGLDSIDVDRIPSVMGSSVDSHDDGFLSDEDFGAETMQEPSSGFDENMESSKDLHGGEETDTTEEELDKSTEHDDLQDGDEFGADFLSEEDFTGAGFLTDHEETESKDSAMSDPADEFESSWEHQDLIDQLKIELRKVRDTGLPTILEESESPKIMEDLKPWKIDEKLWREDGMGELHKFYKSYRERMRKLDILNYQKMYAMGLLQLKDSVHPTANKKPSAPSLRSLVSQNLWLSKHKSQGSDPMKKFITELEGDVEVVYVGQMCASWEMLYWQYEKALVLWDSDPRGIYRYNEVAGEFQQFQVLMQRFVEDEPFQGPRVQNYAKTRCVLRNLLQVPVIRVDNLKDKKWRVWTKDRDESVITIETLVEIVEESIRIFWRFIKADKDCSSTPPPNTHNKIVPQLYDPEDLSLSLAVRKILQKKERKLKDMLRSENCVLRRFQRCRHDGEDEWDQVLLFFSQVDMRLVSRVLRMPKITRDQLIWCHDKLKRISFVNRKMCVEPGFLLFPC
ncbi:hypothetical protein F511_33471 [Dorcoceras hygrometricum]|uniref:Ribosomal protein L34Ae n=1 Tax=Dorcoceras hygrometricum TaxID=472368 RepID=A0A2Z7B0Q7_9LAMI|nr:hypothetical protein F511_33471 [Dorcoceras hygrometricum]